MPLMQADISKTVTLLLKTRLSRSPHHDQLCESFAFFESTIDAFYSI